MSSSDEVMLRENTETLLNQIYLVNNSNSYRVKLYKDSRTLPIMDGFCKSGKDYLVFTDRFYMDGYYLSPVVAYCKKDINSYKTDLSMTNFKKMFKFYSSSNDIIYEEKSREYPLVKCLYNLSLENASKGVLPFDLPCQFNAQDSKNRTGYGNEYWGDELIYEGPKYGETTTYYFIGVLIKPIN